MIISYYDEAGDDGYPKYSSPLFVLTCIYFHYQNWQPIFDWLRETRKYLRETYGFPINLELHTKDFLFNKNPYKKFNFSNIQRLAIVDTYCKFISTLEMKVINVVINKTKITNPTYDVLDRCFTYSIQRIENDLNSLDPASKFMIITDPGRLGKMRSTARRIRKINYIPSKFGPVTYRREIQKLIEDPIQKESDQSYFIQTADLISYIVYRHKCEELGVANIPNRLAAMVNKDKIIEWMDSLYPIFNTKASSNDLYGIVCYPK